MSAPLDPTSSRQPAGVEPDRCLFCGEPEHIEILEIWGHEFALDTCCSGLHESATAYMNDEPESARRWLNSKLRDVLPGGPDLRRIADDGAGGLILDFRPTIEATTLAEVRRFVARHHRHCGEPTGWRFGCAVSNGARTRVGVLSAGRPVARMLDQRLIVEVNRLCIDPTLPSPLAWNVASQMYGWAARKARALGAEWIITYTLASEEGTSLLAAGWEPDHVTLGRKGWGTASRPRAAATPTEDKIRWRRRLAQQPRTELAGNARDVLAKWGKAYDDLLEGRDLLLAMKRAVANRPRRRSPDVRGGGPLAVEGS